MESITYCVIGIELALLAELEDLLWLRQSFGVRCVAVKRVFKPSARKYCGMSLLKLKKMLGEENLL